MKQANYFMTVLDVRQCHNYKIKCHDLIIPNNYIVLINFCNAFISNMEVSNPKEGTGDYETLERCLTDEKNLL